MDNIGNIFASYRKNLKYSQQDICDKLTGMGIPTKPAAYSTWDCLLYTSDAADD